MCSVGDAGLGAGRAGNPSPGITGCGSGQRGPGSEPDGDAEEETADEPAFWPGPSKRLFGNAADHERGGNRQTKGYGDTAANSWPLAGGGGDHQDYEDQCTKRSKRFGWAGHKTKGA